MAQLHEEVTLCMADMWWPEDSSTEGALRVDSRTVLRELSDARSAASADSAPRRKAPSTPVAPSADCTKNQQTIVMHPFVNQYISNIHACTRKKDEGCRL